MFMHRPGILVSLTLAGLSIASAALAMHLLTASALGSSCTQVIGFSQTMQWYADAPDFEATVGDDQWQLLWNLGAGVDSWADPGYVGWSIPVVSPCTSASANPDRIVFTISGEPRSPSAWAVAIDAAVTTIRDKYPALSEVALQPVVGGPGHQVCPAPGGGDVRASASHPDIDQGIAMVVGGDVVAGASPEVGACDDYEDALGHLTQTARGPMGATIGEYYAGGKAVGGVAELPGLDSAVTASTSPTGDSYGRAPIAAMFGLLAILVTAYLLARSLCTNRSHEPGR